MKGAGKRRAAPATAAPLWRRAAVLALLQLPRAALADAPLGSPLDLTALPFEQLLSLEVYSASKFLQPASEAPSTVSVISAAEIRDFGWRTLADVLRSVRGLYLSYDRNYSYLGARAFLRPGDYNTRFLLQIDGKRINDPVYDQAAVGGEFPLDLNLIERIEYVPGPGSSIYVAAKSGIEGFAPSLRKELGERDIKVGLIEPGFTGADFQYPEFPPEKQVELINQHKMLRAEDIAAAAHFMLTQPRRAAVSLMRVKTRLEHP